MQAAKRVAFGATLAVFAASWIAPRWPVEQALHSSLTVLGLAGAAWARGIRVLVIDLDPQANATVALDPPFNV